MRLNSEMATISQGMIWDDLNMSNHQPPKVDGSLNGFHDGFIMFHSFILTLPSLVLL